MPNHIRGILILDKSGQGIARKGQGIALTLPSNALFLPGKKRYRNQGKGTVSSIVGSFKSVCSKHIHKTFPAMRFSWQPRFWDVIIRDKRAFDTISKYIKNNRLKWNDDKFKTE